MKNIFTKLLAIMTLVICTLSLVACGGVGKKPNFDLKDAAKTLKEKEYEITYCEDEDELDLGEVEYLKAYKYDEDHVRQHITITIFKTTKLAKIYFEGIKLEYKAEIESEDFFIKTQELLLKEFEDRYDSDEIEMREESIEEMKKDLEEIKANMAYGRKGKIVWEGTPQAVEDTKK